MQVTGPIRLRWPLSSHPTVSPSTWKCSIAVHATTQGNGIRRQARSTKCEELHKEGWLLLGKEKTYVKETSTKSSGTGRVRGKQHQCCLTNFSESALAGHVHKLLRKNIHPALRLVNSRDQSARRR